VEEKMAQEEVKDKAGERLDSLWHIMMRWRCMKILKMISCALACVRRVCSSLD